MVSHVGFFIVVTDSWQTPGDYSQEAGTHALGDTLQLSPQEMGERFDLLATDAKEYAVFLVGLDGHLLCWNPGAERLFGYQSNEIIGQHFSRFFSPEDILTGQPEHELKTALADGRADSDCWQVRKDGTRFWCQATVTPLLDENKQARSFARVMHDLTESEAVEAQRKRADGLAEANRSKEEFMALLSHELRSPLSPILNALNILRQMRTNDPIIEQAGNIIDRQVGQMVRLVDDLLDISRITKGKLRLTKEQVELRVVVNHAAETARPLMDARKHDFSVSLPTEPIWVEADPARMEQVVVNLLNNAAKYTDTGGLIRMTVNQEGDEAVIRVRDNGVGIAPETAPPHLRAVHPSRRLTRPVVRRTGDRSGSGCATWWRCTKEGCKRPVPGLGKGMRVHGQAAGAVEPRRGTKRKPFWSRARLPDDLCACWWWKITSMPPTA